MNTLKGRLFFLLLPLLLPALSCVFFAPTGKLPEIKKDCTICHEGDAKKGPAVLIRPLSELCLLCHQDRKAAGEHRVDIVPAMKVKKLPLSEGKLTCITCHDPHANRYGKMLRVRPKDLCGRCHKY